MKTKTDPNAIRLKGKVLNFIKRKGFGFILGEDNQKIFVHFSDIRGKKYRYLVADEPVEYSKQVDSKGVQAKDVVRLDPPPEEETIEILNNQKTW
ncbi:cold shock domain-containing protein [bacterium]|nr:cold shock domain-containing protein [bacterium]